MELFVWSFIFVMELNFLNYVRCIVDMYKIWTHDMDKSRGKIHHNCVARTGIDKVNENMVEKLPQIVVGQMDSLDMTLYAHFYVRSMPCVKNINIKNMLNKNNTKYIYLNVLKVKPMSILKLRFTF